jgi:NAD(P)-dependent dehydrogenase (short-subunit alcohol dehydrogenase family)
MKLLNKVAIITGSSRGIGAATAKLFAEEGAHVVVNYKKNKAAAETVFNALKGKDHLLILADVTKEEEIKRLVKDVIKKYGHIDILINNAGEIIRPGDWKTDVKTWQDTLDANLTSAWLMTREVASIMQKQESGVIVNLASTVGIRGVAPVLAYSCAKNGIVAMTKAFAKELAPHIRVNAVAPSNVMTDMTKGAGQDFIEFTKQNTPLKRIAEPEELAKPILFLVSDDASYITGHTLIVDGGHSLK